MQQRQWDIFCTVVDNYGDIGVTWRLARQLVAEFDQSVRLWVDDLASFSRLCPDLDPALPQQTRQGVAICRWDPEFDPAWLPGDLVIEAFACQLPPCALRGMAQASPRPLWLNLEYLSAEAWIDDCHGLPSLQSNGLAKHFFFPGFSPRSGGLLCEGSLTTQRQAWQADPAQRQALFARLGVPAQPAGCRYISLFTYETPALPGLLQAWADGEDPICLLVPEGRVLASLQPWLDQPLKAGDSARRGQLQLVGLPMTDQAGYDRLLWSCDLNLVRGEDSFLRAQWAARPFLWHIYQQEDDIHLEKLQAFMARYLTGLSAEARQALLDFHLAYDRGEAKSMARLWPQWCQHSTEYLDWAQRWPAQVLSGGDLASRLVQWLENRLEYGV